MTQPTERSASDWWRLGAVGVAAVLLSLIGFSIASRYQPGDTLPPVADDDQTTTTSAQVTTTFPSATTSTPRQTTTTATPAEPAALALSREVVDFGEGEDRLIVDVVHVRGGSARWELSSDDPGLSIEPATGDIESGEVVSVTVSIDRSQIAEGDFEAQMTLSWADGQETAAVVAVSEDNPVIHNPRVSPSTVQVDAGSGCSPTRATISARVRDTSGIDRVIARWSHDGSATRETVMSPVGNDIYEGVIGPYEAVGSDSVKVVAFDVRGNAGGASVSLAVVACS